MVIGEQAFEMTVDANALAIIGTFFGLVNFCVSFLRYPIRRWLAPDLHYKYVSPIPLIGSILLWSAAYLFLVNGRPKTSLFFVLVSVVDTGGPHWLVVSLAEHWVLGAAAETLDSGAKIIGYTVLLSLSVTLITLAFPRIEPAENAIWDKTLPVYLSDFTYVPVRGWPLYFVVHSPLGIRLLGHSMMFDIVLWAVPSFLVTTTIFIAHRVKTRTRT